MCDTLCSYMSFVIYEQTFRHRRVLVWGVVCSRVRDYRQYGMDLILERLVDDVLMLDWIARAFVDVSAEVEPVAEQLVQEPPVDRLAALVQGSARHQLPGQQGGRSQLDKPLEDVDGRAHV